MLPAWQRVSPLDTCLPRAGLTCCEGYLINVDTFCSDAAVSGAAAEQEPQPSNPGEPEHARPVLPRPTGLKRRRTPLHVLSQRQCAAPGAADVGARTQQNPRSGAVPAQQELLPPYPAVKPAGCLYITVRADEDILLLLGPGGQTPASCQQPAPGELQPCAAPLRKKARAACGAGSPGSGPAQPTRWAIISTAGSQPRVGQASQPAARGPAPAAGLQPERAAALHNGQPCQAAASGGGARAGARGAAGQIAESRAAAGSAPSAPAARAARPWEAVNAGRGQAAGRPGGLGEGLRFPGEQEAAAAPRRRARMPDAFAGGPAQYERAFAAALVEELNLRLVALARRFHAARAPLRRCAIGLGLGLGLSAAPASGGQPGAGRLGGRTAGAGGRGGRGAPGRSRGRAAARGGAGAGAADPGPALQRACRSAHLAFFAAGSLSVWRPRRGGDAEAAPAPPSHYLTLGGVSAAQKAAFRKDDLWVVGSSLALEAPPARRAADRMPAPWVAIARSCWHGPNQEGRCGPTGA